MDHELEQLGERIAEHAAHLDAATHRLLTDIREFDQRGGWYKQGALSCAHWLSWRVGWTPGTARDRVRVALKLGDLPVIDDALRRGEISYSKVRAMVRVATPENESLLLDHARFTTGAQLEAICRKLALVQRHGEDPHPLGDLQRRYVRRRDTEDGMIKIEAVLHPEEAELVWTMLNHAATELTRRSGPLTCNAAATVCDAASAEALEPVSGPGTASTSPFAHAVASAACGQQAPELQPACSDASSDRVSAEARDSLPTRSTASTSPFAYTAATQTGGGAVPELQPTCSDASPDSVSAEARDSLPACSTVSTLLSVHMVAAGTDTGQGPGRMSPCDTEVPSLVVRAEMPHADESTEASASTDLRDLHDPSPPPERLLDEADPLRDMAAVSSDEHRAAQIECARADHTGVLHQRADTARRAFNRADALVSLAQGYLRGDRPDRSPIEVTLAIPASSLRPGSEDPVEVGEFGESFVSSETARRLSCDSGVVEVVEDEHGNPLSVGRKRRTISGSLKRALYQRDKTCTYPGCANRLFLEGHHITHWADGGETSIMNMTLLCTFHHHFVHEYRYTIELGPDQRPQFRDPHGRLVAAVPERRLTADLGWPHIFGTNAALSINAETPACGWDGQPPDYGRIIGHLLVADGFQ